jgi:predicted DNA-binding protein
MSTLTIRLPEREKKRLASQASKAGLSTAALVREMIQSRILVTGDDILREIDQHMGDEKLRVRRS